MQLEQDPNKQRDVLNPYIKLLTDALPASRARTVWFRWAGVLTDKFDIVHMHWPEFYLRHHAWPGRLVKSALFTLFTARVIFTSKAIVRTIHNVKPHEPGGWYERLILSWIERNTDCWVILNDSTPSPDPSRTFLIPHGHYRDWYSIPSEVDIIQGRVTTFGRIRGYKGIDELASSFTALDDKNLSLVIAGKPDSEDTENSLRKLSKADDRIQLDLRFIPDDDLTRLICTSEAVVLPYRDILNSGSALLSLSLNRPLIIRRTPSTELLQAEMGPAWVVLYDGSLTSSKLKYCLAQLSNAERPSEVDMHSRDWPLLGKKLMDVYTLANWY